MTEKQQSLEWRISVPSAGGTSSSSCDHHHHIVVPPGKSKSRCRCCGILLKKMGFVGRAVINFLDKAWNLGASDPRKLIHCLKVGIALSIVSIFYYMRPLYQGVGGNAMWAIMTVVVVFEYTVGATLCKSINRATGTFLAGLLGVGVHWVATRAGQRFEPIILGFSIFLLASATTFSRFIPSIKARFDYGAMIFILTFSLVSVSGYRVEKLFELAHQRLTTVAIGTSLCILTSMLISPVWAGLELHNLIHRNLDKLASSLQGCASILYFNEDLQCQKTDDQDQDHSKNMEAYKCVLYSKATEETMANFARWEPAHGCFSFRHPWKQYLKIGGLMRDCACCIETLVAFVDLDVQVPDKLKRHLKEACLKVSSHSSDVLIEAALMMRNMMRSYKLEDSVGEMNFAVQQLQDALIAFPTLVTETPGNSAAAQPPPPDLLELVPLLTLVSLLMEISARIEDITDAIIELAEMADFKPPPAAAKAATDREEKSSSDHNMTAINTNP